MRSVSLILASFRLNTSWLVVACRMSWAPSRILRSVWICFHVSAIFWSSSLLYGKGGNLDIDERSNIGVCVAYHGYAWWS